MQPHKEAKVRSVGAGCEPNPALFHLGTLDVGRREMAEKGGVPEPTLTPATRKPANGQATTATESEEGGSKRRMGT